MYSVHKLRFSNVLWVTKRGINLELSFRLSAMHTNARKEKISAYIGKWTFVHFSNAE